MNQIIEQKQINLSSNSADIYNNSVLNSSLVFNFSGLLKDEEDIIGSYISINHAEIPVSFYIINEYNNILYYNKGSGLETLNFPNGNYNASQFITKFKELMTNWNCVIDRTTGLLTFSYTGNFTFYKESTIFRIIGFSNSQNYTSVSNSLTAPLLCDFSGIRRLSIRSNILRLMNSDSNTNNYTNDIQTIQVNAPSYGIIKYENTSGFKSKLSNKTIDNIDIEIYDEFNNLVDFNGCNWTLTLELTIIRIIHTEEKLTSRILIKKFNDLINIFNKKNKNEQQDEQQPEESILEQQDTSELPFGDENSLDFLMFEKGIYI